MAGYGAVYSQYRITQYLQYRYYTATVPHMLYTALRYKGLDFETCGIFCIVQMQYMRYIAICKLRY